MPSGSDKNRRRRCRANLKSSSHYVQACSGFSFFLVDSCFHHSQKDADCALDTQTDWERYRFELLKMDEEVVRPEISAVQAAQPALFGHAAETTVINYSTHRMLVI